MKFINKDNKVSIFDLVNNNLEVCEENIGKTTTVQCTVQSKYEHPNGHIFLSVVTLNNKEIEIPIFNELEFDNSTISRNAQLKVTGKINEYKEKLQVIPQNKNDIVVLTNEDVEEELVKIDNITKEDKGKVVILRGIPTNLYDKNGNLFFYLVDGNKSLKAVLFKADADEVQGRKDKINAYTKNNKAIRVLGTIDVYNNEVEIIIDKVFNND